jgi:hypothetical protein
MLLDDGASAAARARVLKSGATRLVEETMGTIERAACGAALLAAAVLAGCGSSGPSMPASLGDAGAPTVTVTFQNHCTQSVTVYQTDPSGSSCTQVSGPVTPAVASASAYSASTTGSPDCAQGTRVEITPGTNGDVSYDISTNAMVMQPPFFNVPVQFLALQSTAPTACALPVWDGDTGPQDLRGVSSQQCGTATCPTAYQNPTSGPQFITRNTAASAYVVEWCPAMNPAPIPTCTEPPFDASSPCANVCWADAVQSPAPCDTFPDHVMCDVAPFGGEPPASYCLTTTDCTNDGQACGCCTSDADCTGGKSCVNFLCR